MRQQSIGPLLRTQWRFFSTLPGGRWLFSRLLGLYVPYTASIGATIMTLSPGQCSVVLRDRRRVRNHLHSIHAMALCNLAEMATGLALLNGLPNGARGILKRFSIDYLKKSRGRLVATCSCPIPDSTVQCDFDLQAIITDSSGTVTALADAQWRVGPETLTHNGNGHGH